MSSTRHPAVTPVPRRQAPGDVGGGGGSGGGGGGGGGATERAITVIASALFDMERASSQTQTELGQSVTRELPGGSRFSVVPSTLYRYRFSSYARHMALEVFIAMLRVLYGDIAIAFESLARAVRTEQGSGHQQTARQQRRAQLLDIFDRLPDRSQEVALGMMRGVLEPLATVGADHAAAEAEAARRQHDYEQVRAELAEAGRVGDARQAARRASGEAEGAAGAEGAEQTILRRREGSGSGA